MLTVPVGLAFLGITVALFLQCMGTLLSPANPIGKGMRWALVAHTVAMFLFLTISMGISYHKMSIDYINNREFPGNDKFPPGPMGYDDLLQFDAITTVFVTMFPLNQWLADGLLVNPILNSVAPVYNTGRSCSCIVAMSFIP